jgi:signal transduction histidine kinase
VAHELRTPLTAIAGELESIRTNDATIRAAIDRARHDAARLAETIDAILYLSRPGGEPERGASVVNVADVVREIGPTETRVRAPDEALVSSDAALVELAVRNLLDNARKHAGRPATDVVVEREGERVRVTVIDDGPGVDEATRTRMFERYFRGSSASGGTGLGLALVRAVARRHGGDATASAGQGGRGLAVSITLGPLLGWYDRDARVPPSRPGSPA